MSILRIANGRLIDPSQALDQTRTEAQAKSVQLRSSLSAAVAQGNGVLLERSLDHAKGLQASFLPALHSGNHIFLNLFNQGHEGMFLV